MLGPTLGLMLQAAWPAVPGPSLITQPDWIRRPTGENVRNVYPREAMRKYLSGRATLSCVVSARGELEACAVEEDPKGEGFGEAALRLRPLFKMRPMTVNGTPVGGGRVRIPIRFLLPDIRAAPVVVSDPTIKGVTVELNCRFQDSHLDDCFPMNPAQDNVRTVATRLANEVTLPPLPRPTGRITIPLQFKP